MRKLLFLLLTLSSIPGVQAQEWQPFQRGEKYNYSLANKQFYATIWVDSTAFVNNDSVFYFNKVLKKVKTGAWQYPNFYLNDQSQFFFTHFIFGESRELKFTENDTTKFLIKPLASVNEQWIFDVHNNITATVITEDEVSIFGETDSIKLITLSNSDTIIISKNHSFLKFPLFDTLNQHVILAGIEGRNLGIQVPEFSDFFDFDPSDVFYYSYQSSMGNNGHFLTSVKEKVTVLSKTISNNSIIYHCSYNAVGSRYDYLSIPPNRTFYYSQPDTSFVYVNSENNFLNKYPNEILRNSSQGETYKPVIVDFDTNWNTIIKTYPNNNYCKYSGSDTITEVAGPYSCKKDNEYQVCGVKLGIMKTYYWYADVMGSSSISRSRTLVGYIHNGVELGVIYNDSIFKDTSDINDPVEESYRIYPNPVKELLQVEDLDYFQNALLLIYDSNGKLINSKAIISTTTEIDVRSWRSGMYILKITSDAGVFIHKFIKE